MFSWRVLCRGDETSYEYISVLLFSGFVGPPLPKRTFDEESDDEEDLAGGACHKDIPQSERESLRVLGCLKMSTWRIGGYCTSILTGNVLLLLYLPAGCVDVNAMLKPKRI